jgi:hypothetical protein
MREDVRMRSLLMVVALVGLSGCAAERPVDQAAKHGAEMAYMACLDRQAARLDDGISDAASIAYAVAGACSGLAVQMVDIGTPSLNRLDQMTVERRVAGDISAAETVVLSRRRGLRHDYGRGQTEPPA